MKRALWAFLALPVVLSVPLSAETRWERSARKKQEITKGVVWPSHEPLMFHLRRGTHEEDWPEIYARQHHPDNVKRMAEAGVRLLRLHFYKGFGLALEMPEIANSQKMADLMHGYGMKVSLYIAGTLFAELGAAAEPPGNPRADCGELAPAGVHLDTGAPDDGHGTGQPRQEPGRLLRSTA